MNHYRVLLVAVLALAPPSGRGATWYSRTLPCPADPRAAQACQKLRRINVALYGVALVSFAVGLAFAFVLPKMM